MSPTYSVCSDHGYLAGEVYTCPHCGRKTEVYSRITGYYRPVQNWNDGKTQEFKDRKVYDISRSVLRHGPAAAAEETEETAASDELLLFTTRTCPNCAQAEKLLQEAGLTYRKLLAEENAALVKEFGIRQAPTLVSGEVKVTGVGPIRKFISAN